MANAPADRALAALLTPDADAAAQPGRGRQPLPSLDERVQMFLRALHGDRPFTAEERAAARNRLLDAMAASLAGGAEIPVEKPQDPAATATTGSEQSVWAGIFATLRDALLFPLTGSGFGGRLALAGGLAVVIVGLAWSVTWWHAAQTAETTIASLIKSEGKSGRAYTCGSRTVGGFPFAVEVSCLEPKATINSGGGRFVINAKELRTTASILKPGELVTDVVGPVSVADAGRAASYLGNWTAGRTVVRSASDGPEQFSVVLEGAQFYRVAQGMEPLLTSGRLELDVRRERAGAGAVTFAVAVRADEAALPTGGPVASRPFVADIRAVLHGPETALARWRDWQAAGGHLEIQSARLEQGEAVGTAAGDIRLNGAGRIEGNLRTVVVGPYAQLAQSFIRDGAGGAIEREKITQALPTAMGQIHARSLGDPQAPIPSTPKPPPAQGAWHPAGSLEVPIRFVDGTVYIGSRVFAVVPPVF